MKKTIARTILVAVLAISLCTVLVIGGTYSLFSDSVTVGNHLQAGTLKVSLVRTCLTKTILNADGNLVTKTDAESFDFTKNMADVNLFGIENGEKIAPGASYEAELALKSDGSVAFDYKVVISLGKDTEANALAEQLIVYIDGNRIGTLSEFTEGNEATVATGNMTKDQAAKTFTIKLAFENVQSGNGNNDAQGKSAAFDLYVAATQSTAS